MPSQTIDLLRLWSLLEEPERPFLKTFGTGKTKLVLAGIWKLLHHASRPVFDLRQSRRAILRPAADGGVVDVGILKHCFALRQEVFQHPQRACLLHLYVYATRSRRATFDRAAYVTS